MCLRRVLIGVRVYGRTAMVQCQSGVQVVIISAAGIIHLAVTFLTYLFLHSHITPMRKHAKCEFTAENPPGCAMLTLTLQ